MHNVSYFIGNQSNVSESQVFKAKKFKDLAKYFSKCTKGGKHSAYWVRGLLDGSRKDDNLSSSRVIIIDGDEGKNGRNAPKVGDVSNVLKELGYNHFIYTSHSHNESKNKFRAVVECSEYDKSQLIVTNIAILKLLAEKGVFIKHVREMDAWSQPWFVPTRDDPLDGLFEYCEWFQGNELRAVNPEKDEESGEIKQEKSNEQDIKGLITNIITGKEYHTSMLNISYQLMKQGWPSSSIQQTFEAMMENGRDKDIGGARWLRAFNEIPKLLDKNRVSENMAEPPKGKESGKIPVFPDGILSKWPEPWGEIFKNYYDMAREPIEELLVPTILSSCAFLLKTNYLTHRGRRPNLVFLNLAASGVGKDVNTINVIEDLQYAFGMQNANALENPFDDMLDFDADISADTSFMQSFDEEGRFFWMNTEATSLFQLIGTKNNPHVAALGKKVIQTGDGKVIQTKRKSKNKQNDLMTIKQTNPNCQILLCAQTNTIKDHLKPDLVDTGFFGRPLISISAKEFKVDEFDLIGDDEGYGSIKISDEFLMFFRHLAQIKTPVGILGFKTIIMDKENKEKIMEWQKMFVNEHLKEDGVLRTVLRRMGIAIEQIYVMVVGIMREYDEMKGRKLRSGFDVEKLIPLLTYWMDCKIYACEHLVREDFDPMANAILEIMGKVLRGELKMTKTNEVKAVKLNMLPVSKLLLILNNQSSLLKSMELMGDKLGISARLAMSIKNLEELGTIVRCKSGKTPCIAFANM